MSVDDDRIVQQVKEIEWEDSLAADPLDFRTLVSVSITLSKID